MTSLECPEDGICQLRSAGFEALTQYDNVAEKLICHSTCHCGTGDKGPHRPVELGSWHLTGMVRSGVDRGNQKSASEIFTKATEFTLEPRQVYAPLRTEPSTKIIDGWCRNLLRSFFVKTWREYNCKNLTATRKETPTVTSTTDMVS